MSFRSPRLDAVFGGPLSTASGSALRAAIDAGIAESQELDWKEAVPSDLPVCAASFANAEGGAIVIGVAQTDRGLKPAPLSTDQADKLRNKVAQQLASTTYPMLRVEVETVPDPSPDGGAYVVILIPQSPDAPHAVAERGAKGRLRYPRRVDTTTEYMTEAAVAAAYRTRFGRSEETASRLAKVIDTGFSSLNHDRERWLYLAMVPLQRQRVTYDRKMYAATSRWIQSPNLGSIKQGGLAGFHPMPHVNRTVLIAPGHAVSPGAHFETYELCGDGSGFAAWQIELPDRDAGFYLSQSQLIDTLIKQINVLANYASTIAGTSGAAVAEVGIADWERGKAWDQSLFFGEPGIPPTVRVRPMTGTHSWQVPIDIGAIVGSSNEMLDTTRILAMGITQAFGYVEPTLITSGGWIDVELWPDPDQAERWALSRGVQGP